MTDFESAFRTGIDAARMADFKRGEIARVLREFSASLELSTRGKLKVALGRSRNVAETLLKDFLPTRGDQESNALYLMTTDEPTQTALVAGWKQSAEGYPVWINIGGQDTACLDRPGLEDELMRLAASPQMGAAVLKLAGDQLSD